MTRTDEAVDADGHILEPLTLWDDYIDPAFRERRPRFVIDDNGKERRPMGIGCRKLPKRRQNNGDADVARYLA
jgi:hypothetical protein